MTKPLICLSLTGKTLHEDVKIVEKYRKHIDLVELRVDFLDEEEQLCIRRFPAMVNVPCILTIRRQIDGGKYTNSELSRITLFGQALSLASQNPAKNFAYVDFEDDFHILGLYEAALAFGIKIIRSLHDFENPIVNIHQKCEQMKRSHYEIPKIAFMPKKLSDVTRLFAEAKNFTDFDHILCAMGPLGIPSRILSGRLNSYLTYTSPLEMDESMKQIGHIDPDTLDDLYRFRSIDADTEICAVTGYPLTVTSSPYIHNTAYKEHNMNRVFIPMPSTSMEESIDLANQLDITGMAVTVPYKVDAMRNANEVCNECYTIGACNTLIKKDNKWYAQNTDYSGFKQALCEFLGVKKLHHRKVAIIGAGGAAHAIAYAIKLLGGKACIFNRTKSSAEELAKKFGFTSAPLTQESEPILRRYSDIIIQTTNVGMYSNEPSSKENNPIWFYKFTGSEHLYDIIYEPQETPVMKEARLAGCAKENISNGFSMLKYQGERQFLYFTGEEACLQPNKAAGIATDQKS